MSEVEKHKKELAKAIVNSEEYKEYLRCRDILAKNVDLYRSVNEMRKQNFMLQNAEDVSNMFEETEKLRCRYEEIRNNIVVNNFLRAEMCLCRMIQDINRTLMNAIDFDMGFLK